MTSALADQYLIRLIVYVFTPVGTAVSSGYSAIPSTYFIAIVLVIVVHYNMSLVMRKPDLCICENKDADQLRGNREADQRLCFRYTDSTVPLLPKSEISKL